MFYISTKAQYGLGLLQILATHYDRGFMSLKEIGRLKQYPSGYLQEIASPLKKAGFLISKEGLGGGYRLARRPETIGLLQVLEILDGPIQPVKCLYGDFRCPKESLCLSRDIWHQAAGQLAEFFRGKTLADLVGQTIKFRKQTVAAECRL